MSLESWEEEFYGPMPDSDRAIEHSLKKWRGLRQSNLDKHECIKRGLLIKDKKGINFTIDGSSCALCVYHPECETCPIFKKLGKTCDDGDESPFRVWLLYSDPEPMINILEKLV